MDLDPDDVFRDEDEDPENEFFQENEASKEYVVYLVDASPKMFNTTCPSDDQKHESHFHIAVSCVSQALKTQIINRSNDAVGVCFFNTREKKNLQDSNGVYLFNVSQRKDLDSPTAKYIKELERIEESFMTDIGSQYGIVSGSRENSLYNALWVAQALLRKGSAKTAEKRILLLTNEDDPFGSIKGVTKADMMRTTLQRAKDAQDLGISIELIPLSKPDEQFNVSLFYSDMLGLEGEEIAQYMQSSGQKLEDLKDQLKKKILSRRITKRITFVISDKLSIQLNAYALLRPMDPGKIIWLDSVTNLPLKVERSLICADTGALMNEQLERVQLYKNETIKFSEKDLSEIKKISTGHLRLLGFKPLSCLKDYFNLKPSLFLYPSDQEVVGTTCIFVALHRSMLQQKRFAIAFYGAPSIPRLVALLPQEEIVTPGGQIEPPGMNMIYLPYADDIRDIEEFHSGTEVSRVRATDDQIKKAVALMKRMELKDFSVYQFANPALQRHYAILQALALDEDEIPEIKDETLPDEEGMNRPGVVKAIEEFKNSVDADDGEDDEENNSKQHEKTRKRKADADDASKECEKYDWAKLADKGKLKDLTINELKHYLKAHKLPLVGKKDVLISRILSHLGK